MQGYIIRAIQTDGEVASDALCTFLGTNSVLGKHLLHNL